MKRKGFGLILVLLFTAIVLMVVSSIALSLVNDVRLNRQSKNAAAAYSMARSGIGDAIYALKSNTTEENPIEPTKNGTYKSCDIQIGNFNYSDSGIPPYTVNTLENRPAYPGNSYGFQLCAKGTATNQYIIGIGYAGGQKITLKAKIFHKDTYIVSYKVTTSLTDPVTGLITTSTEDKTCTNADTNCPKTGPTGTGFSFVGITWDHTKDYFKIYQAGS